MHKKDIYQTPRGWTILAGDVNWEEYGATWVKKGRDGSYYAIVFTNMEDAVGEDDFAEGGLDRYEAAVKRVDLSTLPAEQIKSAMESCGFEWYAGDPDPEMEDPPGILLGSSGGLETDPDKVALILVDCVLSYSGGTPLGEETGNGWPLRVRKAAMRLAESYMADSDALETALDRPVNKIGSTAREYGNGDIWSALRRGDSPMHALIKKMYKASEGRTLGGVEVPPDILE